MWGGSLLVGIFPGGGKWANFQLVGILWSPQKGKPWTYIIQHLFGTLMLVLCCCGDHVKYKLLSKHLFLLLLLFFQRRQEHGCWQSHGNNKMLLKWCLSLIKWHKKTSMKQAVPITCALEERLFASATFEGKCH